jgi:hypothetical protein
MFSLAARQKARKAAARSKIGEVKVQGMTYAGAVAFDGPAAERGQLSIREAPDGRWSDRLENRYKSLTEAEEAAARLRRQACFGAA